MMVLVKACWWVRGGLLTLRRGVLFPGYVREDEVLCLGFRLVGDGLAGDAAHRGGN